MHLLKHPLRQALLLASVLSGLALQSAFGVEQTHTRLTVAAAKSVDALWALQLDDGEDTAVAAYLTSAAEGEQTTSTFLDQDGQNHPLFRAEDDDTWRPDRYAREALAYSESHDDLLGRTLREKTTRSVWQGVRDKTSETGGALGEQIISAPWGTVKAVGGAIKNDTWEMVRHPIRTAGNIGKGVWTLGKDAAYNLGNSAKSTWAGSFGTENALNTLYGRNMGAPLLGMSAIQATLTAAQVVPVAKGAQALGKGALRAGKTIGEKGLFQLGRGEGVASAGVSGKVADDVVGEKVVNTTVQANKAAGDAFEAQIKDKLQRTYTDVVQQVTIKTQSGVRTRVDFLSRDSSGIIKCTECKASATAPLTKNQRLGFPEIQQSGGVVVGKGKPGFPGGTQILPTKIDIVRPQNR